MPSQHGLYAVVRRRSIPNCLYNVSIVCDRKLVPWSVSTNWVNKCVYNCFCFLIWHWCCYHVFRTVFVYYKDEIISSGRRRNWSYDVHCHSLPYIFGWWNWFWWFSTWSYCLSFGTDFALSDEIFNFSGHIGSYVSSCHSRYCLFCSWVSCVRAIMKAF